MAKLFVWCLLLAVAASAARDNSSETVSLVPAQLQTVVNYGVYINNEQEHSNVEVLPGYGVPTQIAQLVDDGTLQLTNDLLGAGHIVEGDIMVTEKDLIESYPRPPDDGVSRTRTKRKVSGKTWPNAIIPWEISDTAPPYKQETLDKIQEAMKWWERHTCVRFVSSASRPSVGHDRVLSIKNYLKCSSYVGFQDKLSSNKQVINLFEALCFTSVGTAAHELGHALGLIHEHSRVDRDEYVDIHPNAIDPNSLHNYAKSHRSLIPDDVHYDLSSIMHYNPSTFAVLSSKPAMTGKNLKKQSLMGQRDALSYYDIKAINLHYQCQGSCSNNCENEGYAHSKDGRCTCICPEGLSGSSCQKIDSDCGGTIHLSAGQATTLHSTTYTLRSQATECIWLIKAPTGYNIEINFDEFDIAKSQTSIYRGYTCIHNVEVRNNLLGQRGDIYCGLGPVGPINTDMGRYTNRMLVVLSMTNSSEARTDNFRATMTAYIDPCFSTPCLNQGTCTAQRTSTFTCSCPEGFTGDLCEVITTSGVSCDFAEDFCGFSQDFDDDMDFHREFQSFKYSEELKTQSNNNKFFIGAPVEFAVPRLGATARLRSQTFSSSLPTRCLTFSYFMNGDWQVGVLTVSLVLPGSHYPIKNITTVTRQQQSRVKLLNGWRKETTEISHDTNYQVLFTFTAGTASLYTSMMGLDDISILPQRCHRSPCASSPCKGGGVCSETGETSYQCLCPPGRTGANCDSYDINGFTCDFDSEDLCGWTQDHSDNFDWIRTYGASDILERTGPVKSAEGEGYYVVADTSASTSTPGSEARLISPVIDHKGSICVSFYYHMHGQRVGTLNLILQSYGAQPTQYFSMSGEQSTEWQYTSVDVLLQDSTSRLIFQAIVGQKHLSDIAVDDITIGKGRCGTAIIRLPPVANLPHAHSPHITGLRPGTSTTTTQQTTTTMSSTTTRRTTRRRTTTPRALRTTTQPSHIRHQTTHQSGTTQRSVSSIKQFSNERQPAPSHGVLYGTTVQRSALTARQGQLTNQRSSQIASNTPHSRQTLQRLTVQPSVERLQSPSTGTPGVRRPHSPSTGVPSVRRPHSPSTGTPSVRRPHTPSTGALNVRRPHAPSTGAPSVRRPHSPSTVVPSVRRPHSPSTVAPNVRRPHSPSTGTPSVRRQPSTSTIIQSTTLAQTTPTVRILLQQATPKTRLQRQRLRSRQTSSRLPKGKRSRKLVDCDFEIDTCQRYLYLPVPTQVWKRIKGPTQSAGTGPEAAAAGTYYIHMDASIESNSDRDNNIFRISTYSLQHSGEVCIKFNYHMKGPTVDSLSIYLLPAQATQRLLWQRLGEQGDNWLRAVISTQIQTNSKIVIEAIRGRNYQSDIAIDELSVTKGPCNRTHATNRRSRAKLRDSRSGTSDTTLTSTQVRRLPQVQRRRSNIEYRCDFEQNSFCDFINEDGDDADWIINSGSTRSAGTGPESAQSGDNYIYVEASGPTRPGSVAKLSTPDIPRNAGDLCLVLFVHMYGEDMGQFSVYQLFSNRQRRQLVYRNNGGSNAWSRMGATIPSSSKSYAIVFEAITSNGTRRWLSDIAIDNLSLTSGAC